MVFKIAQFPIYDINISQFTRLVKKPKDCFINALELMGILDSKSADIARILIGDVGVQIDQITDIFRRVIPNTSWRMQRYTNMSAMEEYTSEFLQPGFCIFCGYESGQFKHVFLIGMTTSKQIMYLDPQLNTICDLNECSTYVESKDFYYMLTLDGPEGDNTFHINGGDSNRDPYPYVLNFSERMDEDEDEDEE